MTSEFINGNAYSLDGVHPTPRGYSVFTNLIIESINNTYGTSFSNVDPLDYGGNI